MEDSLLVLLGISGSVIVGFIGLVGVLLRRNGSSNPNMSTLDEKLNKILIVLTRIEAKIGD
ncbi:hypothetical protein LCGC14_0665070 [marine sediment metagenome]|uniref:Uncharacterized protein n=1 Tax=marine sediment metagenome TaxID=412755 RepID=A0A0F9U0M9_9ZZZZ